MDTFRFRSREASVAIAIAIMLAAPGASIAADLDAGASFDAQLIERIVPGTTGREDILEWFGQPDAELSFEDGTSRWVYEKTRVIEGNAIRAQKAAAAKRERRAENAKRFAENTTALVNGGRKQIGNLFDWLDRTFRYPPRPIRRERIDVAAAPEEVTVPPQSIEDGEEVAIEDGEETEAIEELEPVANRARMELVLRFTRDGVVDKFEYRRAAIREDRF